MLLGEARCLNETSSGSLSSGRLFVFGQLDYVLKPGENILIHAPQNAEIDGHIFQIQADGFVTLPAIGRTHAGGVKLRVFEKNLERRFGQNSSDDDVTVRVVAFLGLKAGGAFAIKDALAREPSSRLFQPRSQAFGISSRSAFRRDR